MIVEANYGGVAQGIGGALYQRIATTTTVSSRTRAHGLPDAVRHRGARAAAPPHRDAVAEQRAGVKGVGEAGTIPVAATIANAISARAGDADRPHADLPLAAARADVPVTGVRIGIDTGGTFTDVVAVDPDGHVRSTEGAVRRRATPRPPSCRRSRRPGRRRSATSRTARLLPPTRSSNASSPGSDWSSPAASVPARDRPSERAARLRQLVLLGEAPAHRPAALGLRGRRTGHPRRARWSRRTRPTLALGGSFAPAWTASASASCTLRER